MQAKNCHVLTVWYANFECFLKCQISSYKRVTKLIVLCCVGKARILVLWTVLYIRFDHILKRSFLNTESIYVVYQTQNQNWSDFSIFFRIGQFTVFSSFSPHVDTTSIRDLPCERERETETERITSPQRE